MGRKIVKKRLTIFQIKVYYEVVKQKLKPFKTFIYSCLKNQPQAIYAKYKDNRN